MDDLDWIEGYTLSRQLGHGSFGTVHLVRDNKKRHKYVIKIMDVESIKQRDSALQEADLLSKLNHPNIVRHRDSFLSPDQNQLCIVMQFCEGGDLSQRIQAQADEGGYFTENQIMNWFTQIALAIQYLHTQKILHRDLKTQNIFLTKKGIIKVGDLGIARVLESTMEFATTMVGTPYYMAPELFSEEAYNHKSDIWSLGCCIHELCTLRPAFNARDLTSLVFQVLEGSVPRIPSRYSEGLDSLVMSMLDKDPDKRPSVQSLLTSPFVKAHMQRFVQERTRGKPSSSTKHASSSSLPATTSSPMVSRHDPSKAQSLELPPQQALRTPKGVTNEEIHAQRRGSGSTASNTAARRRRRERRDDTVQAATSPLLPPRTPSKHTYDCSDVDTDDELYNSQPTDGMDKLDQAMTLQLSMTAETSHKLKQAAAPKPDSCLASVDKRLDTLRKHLEATLGRSAVQRLVALLEVNPQELPYETSVIKAVGAAPFRDSQGEINSFMVCWKLRYG
eukprot:TRINITY_DN11882_c0_g1_i14.p1 TRINITY_DN11882_c0_g1~~TRINITY_DN11882_c0_g1_i14.p1  ORF type:complete len:504 (+),score=113.61 TRINITY_DN11882_c0_g1_i14:142-1653(+)